jgi:hypothetical protein
MLFWKTKVILWVFEHGMICFSYVDTPHTFVIITYPRYPVENIDRYDCDSEASYSSRNTFLRLARV